MLLAFANSEPFAIGVTDYFYQPTSNETDNRIILQVEIEGLIVPAIVDTGAPFVVCAPEIARVLGIQYDPDLESKRLLIRGSWIIGQLHRLRLTFIATEGQSLDVSSTVFVPDATAGEVLGGLPSFIGLTGCLERMRFAVDPNDDRFYFGPLTNELE
jgi:hypothetical protein